MPPEKPDDGKARLAGAEPFLARLKMERILEGDISGRCPKLLTSIFSKLNHRCSNSRTIG
jgi:hypothetical protein